MRRLVRKNCLTMVLMIGIMTAAFFGAGCHPLEKRAPVSLPLAPMRMTSKSVVLDMFFVRFPLADTEINGPFWNEIDEQKISPRRRQMLAENGFRTGVISGPIPTRLARLLQLENKIQVDDLNRESTPIRDLQKEPEVSRRHLQLRSGRRGEIVAQEIQTELSVIRRDGEGKVSGETFHNAKPQFSIYTTNLPDGRVRIRLTPEIQHGQMRREFTAGQNGMFKLDVGRESKSYQDLEIEMDLSPGDFLVLSNIPIREGSLGDRFFTESGQEGRCQKLLVIRLSQTQHDDQFE